MCQPLTSPRGSSLLETECCVPPPVRVERPLKALTQKTDGKFDSSVIAWGDADSPRGHLGHAKQLTAVAGEPVLICVDVTNPLAVPVRLDDATLEW